jgi:hypothetical protein
MLREGESGLVFVASRRKTGLVGALLRKRRSDRDC